MPTTTDSTEQRPIPEIPRDVPAYEECLFRSCTTEPTFTINVGNDSNGDPTWRKAACVEHVALWL